MDIRIATFNLENLGIRGEEDTLGARERLPRHLEALRGAIRRLDADVVAFQELLDPGLLEPLLAGFGYAHVALADRASSPLLVGAFSRLPLVGPRTVARAAEIAALDPKAGLELVVRGPFSRPAFEVSVQSPAGEVTLVVVHWKSKIPSLTPERALRPDRDWSSFGEVGEGRLLTEAKRLAQAVALRRHVDERLAESPGRLLVTLGDFNDVLESEGLRIVVGDARACQAPHLAPLELVPCELSIPGDLRFTQRYRGRREMLDHILISQALLPHFVSARAHNERVAQAEEGPFLDPYSDASDHAPLLADFRF